MEWKQVDGDRGGWGRRWGCMAFLPGTLLLTLGVLVLALLLVKLLWEWTVPDLFPKAVEQGLVARSISWFTAFKLAILIAVLAAVTGIRSRRR